MTTTNNAASSAAAGATPAQIPVATTTAPSASVPETLADYAALASAALQQAQAPAPDDANGSPASNLEVTPALEAGSAGAEAPITSESESDEAEPTPEEQATWTASEQRIHGALQKEREKRREAKAEVKAIREELQALKAQTTTPPVPEPSATVPPAPATPPPTAASSMLTEALGDCMTFDAVDARAMQAATVEASVVRLQQTMLREGAEAVRTALVNNGVTALDGIPVAEVDEQRLGDFLGRAYEGSRKTQLSAEPRKRYLVAQHNAMQAALELIPELKDTKSEPARQFAKLVSEVPTITAIGPHWPQVVATYLLGKEVEIKRKQTAPAVQAAPPVAKPAPAKPAPAAPSRAASALPPTDELAIISKKMKDGTVTMAEMATYASRGVQNPRA